MGGTVNMGGKVLYTVIHLYNSCTQYSITWFSQFSVATHFFGVVTQGSGWGVTTRLLVSRPKSLTVG